MKADDFICGESHPGYYCGIAYLDTTDARLGQLDFRSNIRIDHGSYHVLEGGGLHGAWYINYAELLVERPTIDDDQ